MATLRTIGLAAVCALAARPAAAQFGSFIPGLPVDSAATAFAPANILAAGLGLTSFSGGTSDGQYLTLTLQPEVDLTTLGLRSVGVGMYAPLRFRVAAGDDSTASGGFRTEDYDDANEILSILRYVRYGQKNGESALYARFGLLDAANVGYGQLVSFYRNEVGNDARRRGVAFDLDVGLVGFETIYGTLADAGVYAARGYARPFWRPGADAGVVGLEAFAVGLTVAGDLDGDGAFVNAVSPGAPMVRPVDSGEGVAGPYAAGTDDGGLMMVGADLAMPFYSTGGTSLAAYADFASILDYGWGGGAGLGLAVTPPAGMGRFEARVEARYLGDRYLPGMINAFYEVDRVRVVDSTDVIVEGGTRRVPVVQTRRNELHARRGSRAGVFGGLAGMLMGMVRLEGTYQQIFGTDEPVTARGGGVTTGTGTGWLHLGATIGVPGRSYVLGRLSFDKWNIGGTSATLESPNDALFQAEVSSGILQYVQVGLIYENAFQPLYDADDQGKLVGHRRQQRFEPRVALLIPF